MNNTTDKNEEPCFKGIDIPSREELNLTYPADALDVAYEQGLDHALAIVNDAYLAFDGPVMLVGKYTNDVFQSIIKRIKELKK